MKAALLPLLLALLVPPLAGAAAPAAAPKAPGPSEVLRQRIDALLRRRERPDPLPVVLPNPFEPATAAAARLADETEAEAAARAASARLAQDLPPDSSTEALARCTARLRIAGTILLKGQLQVIVNDAPHKEGDIIMLDRNNAMTYLHVEKIEPGAVTLRLNEATQKIRF